MLYNVVLVSGIQQCASAISIHLSLSFWTSSHHLHPTPFNHHKAQSWAPCISPIVMYMFQCYSPNCSHVSLPCLCPQVHSLCLHLYSCPENRFISTIFLDCHIYICINIWYLFSFCLISLCITDIIHFRSTDSNSFLYIN